MADTLRHIVYRIKEELSGYIITDDNPFDDDYLIDKINTVREVLIKDHFKTEGIEGMFYTNICCLEIKCEENGCYLDGTYYRAGTVYSVELPDLISSVGWRNILYFGGVDKQSPYTRKTLDGFMSSSGALWTGHTEMFTIIGSKAYIKNLKTAGQLYVCLTGLLKDPRQACDYLDGVTAYPVPDVHKLELLVKKDIMSMYGIMGDVLHDGRDIKGAINQKQQNEE